MFLHVLGQNWSKRGNKPELWERVLTKMSCPDCFPCCPFLEQALIWHQWAWNASEHLQLKHIETIASSFSCADSSAKGAKGISVQIFRSSPSEVKLRPLPSLRTNAQSKRPRHCQTSPEARRRTVGSPCDKRARVGNCAVCLSLVLEVEHTKMSDVWYGLWGFNIFQWNAEQTE